MPAVGTPKGVGSPRAEQTSPHPLMGLQYDQGGSFTAVETPGGPLGQLCQQSMARTISRNWRFTLIDSLVFCSLLNQWNVLIGLKKLWQIPGVQDGVSFLSSQWVPEAKE